MPWLNTHKLPYIQSHDQLACLYGCQGCTVLFWRTRSWDYFCVFILSFVFVYCPHMHSATV